MLCILSQMSEPLNSPQVLPSACAKASSKSDNNPQTISTKNDLPLVAKIETFASHLTLIG